MSQQEQIVKKTNPRVVNCFKEVAKPADLEIIIPQIQELVNATSIESVQSNNLTEFFLFIV